MTAVEAIRNKNDLKKIEKFLSENNYRDFILFKFGINSGLRISDILSLDVKDVKNKDFNQITEKKTKKLRRIPINSTLLKLFNKYLKNKSDSEPLFISKNNKRLERTFVYKMLNKACEKASIQYKIGTHSLRKTFGYHYYRKYKDIVMLQKILNHSSPSITLRYIGITQEEIYNSCKNFIL